MSYHVAKGCKVQVPGGAFREGVEIRAVHLVPSSLRGDSAALKRAQAELDELAKSGAVVKSDPDPEPAREPKGGTKKGD